MLLPKSSTRNKITGNAPGILSKQDACILGGNVTVLQGCGECMLERIIIACVVYAANWRCDRENLRGRLGYYITWIFQPEQQEEKRFNWRLVPRSLCMQLGHLWPSLTLPVCTFWVSKWKRKESGYIFINQCCCFSLIYNKLTDDKLIRGRMSVI